MAIVGILFAVIYSFRTWPAEIYDNNIDSTLYTNVGELTEGSKVSQQFNVYTEWIKQPGVDNE